MRVLVVDDDASVRSLVRTTLEDDWDVVEAVDGQAALDALRAAVVDLVLLDVMMPGMDGFETLSRIRRADSTVETPVVMLTARAAEADHVRAFKSGADGYLTKPFDVETLSKRLRVVAEAGVTQREQQRQEALGRAELLRQIEQRFAS